jgi:hypothetical protein
MFILLAILLVYELQVVAQTNGQDRIADLLLQLETESNDTAKTLICIELAEWYAQTNYKLSAKYALRAGNIF